MAAHSIAIWWDGGGRRGHAFVTVSYGGVIMWFLRLMGGLPTKHIFGQNLIRPLRLINNDCSLKQGAIHGTPPKTEGEPRCS